MHGMWRSAYAPCPSSREHRGGFSSERFSSIFLSFPWIPDFYGILTFEIPSPLCPDSFPIHDLFRCRIALCVAYSQEYNRHLISGITCRRSLPLSLPPPDGLIPWDRYDRQYSSPFQLIYRQPGPAYWGFWSPRCGRVLHSQE